MIFVERNAFTITTVFLVKIMLVFGCRLQKKAHSFKTSTAKVFVSCSALAYRKKSQKKSSLCKLEYIFLKFFSYDNLLEIHIHDSPIPNIRIVFGFSQVIHDQFRVLFIFEIMKSKLHTDLGTEERLFLFRLFCW